MKVQTGMRIDKLVFDRFKELCRVERLMVRDAVKRLMELCLEVGSVAGVLTLQMRETVPTPAESELSG